MLPNDCNNLNDCDDYNNLYSYEIKLYKLHVIWVYRDLASCKPILSLTLMWITKLPKLKSLHCLGSYSRNISSCCSGNKVARSVLKLIGTSQHLLSSKGFQCQCLLWFYWLVHAVSREIPDCMFSSFQICA